MTKKIEYAIFSDTLNKIVPGYRNLQTKEAAEFVIINNQREAKAFKYRIVSREITYGDWESPDEPQKDTNISKLADIQEVYKCSKEEARTARNMIYFLRKHSEELEEIFEDGMQEDLLQLCLKFASEYLEKEKMWRYTNHKNGGIVFATTKEKAQEKLKTKYEKDNFEVWEWTNDDYYDSDHPDVIDCY